MCDVTDAVAIMFQYTPTVYDAELSFSYSTAMHISGKKITVVKDTRKWYEIYNKKYPTSDREIEKSINTEYFGDSADRFKF